MRGMRPSCKLLHVVVEAIGHAPVRRQRMRAVPGGIGKRRLPFALECRDSFAVGLEIDHIVGDQADHQAVDENAGAAEHAANRYGSEFSKELADRFGVHGCLQCASAAAGSAAGVSCTDSPQPQAEVWFGLLNTKVDESLSTLKSISVPSRNMTAFGSISSLTPLSSTTSSNFCALSAYSIV